MKRKTSNKKCHVFQREESLKEAYIISCPSHAQTTFNLKASHTLIDQNSAERTLTLKGANWSVKFLQKKTFRGRRTELLPTQFFAKCSPLIAQECVFGLDKS